MGYQKQFFAIRPFDHPHTMIVSAKPELCAQAERFLKREGLDVDFDTFTNGLLEIAGVLDAEEIYPADSLVARPDSLTLVPDVVDVVRYRAQSRELANVRDWNNELLSDCVDGDVFACVHDDRLVSWAGIKNIERHSKDVQVATHPDYRRRRFALRACSAAYRSIIESNITPHYAHISSNHASAALARRLGFTPFARIIYAEHHIPLHQV